MSYRLLDNIVVKIKKLENGALVAYFVKETLHGTF